MILIAEAHNTEQITIASVSLQEGDCRCEVLWWYFFLANTSRMSVRAWETF